MRIKNYRVKLLMTVLDLHKGSFSTNLYINLVRDTFSVIRTLFALCDASIPNWNIYLEQAKQNRVSPTIHYTSTLYHSTVYEVFMVSNNEYIFESPTRPADLLYIRTNILSQGRSREIQEPTGPGNTGP